MEMCDDGTCQNRHVVSPFENADDPSLRMRLRDGDYLSRQDVKIFDLQSQVTHRIFSVSVEARADHNEFWPEAVRQIGKTRTKCRMIVGSRCSVGQGDIGRKT